MTTPPWMYRTLGGLLVFVGLGGISGGLSLVTDPTGVGLGLGPEAIEGTPFPDYLVPGLVLLAVNGIGSTVAGVAALRRWRYSGHVGAAFGAFLMAWIIIQIVLVGLVLVPPFQPVFFALGLAELMLGIRMMRSAPGGLQP